MVDKAMPNFLRQRNRLPHASYMGRAWYFVTICTADRRQLFCDSRLVGLMLAVLHDQCASHGFGLYAYCFMPDHAHLEWVGLSPGSDLIKLVRAWKGNSKARARASGLSLRLQRGFYDHVLRPGESENGVAWYIFNNPVRKGLVRDARQWPHTGSWMVDWKKLVLPTEEWLPPWRRGGFTPPSPLAG